MNASDAIFHLPISQLIGVRSRIEPRRHQPIVMWVVGCYPLISPSQSSLVDGSASCICDVTE